jgi:hypothetical protein
MKNKSERRKTHIAEEIFDFKIVIFVHYRILKTSAAIKRRFLLAGNR